MAKNGSEKSPVIKEGGDFENVINLLSLDKSLEAKLRELISELSDSFSTILILPRESNERVHLELLKIMNESGARGIYVTVNKASGEIIGELKKKGIKFDNVFFVDAVSQMAGYEEEGENVSYIESPSDILEISVETDRAIEKLEKSKGFVIIDSIPTLLVYNKPVVVEKFFHALSEKIRMRGLKGFFFASDSTNQEALDIIAQFCDETKNL